MAAKILLAEDDANLRETLSEVLRNEGYEVIAVPNGQAAMDALDQPDAAQVIILDCLLPKVQGFDVAKFIRGRGLDTPIIFISGVFKSQDQQKDAREKYGAKAYLTKPFDAKRLADTVRPLLFGAGGSAQAAAVAQNPLPSEGTLLENPALYLLWRAGREMHTGVLELFGDRPGERARVFIFKGRAVLAQHSDSQLNLGVELVRDGVIDADSYKQAVELALQRQVGLFDVLKTEGWVNDAQAKSAYKVLIPKILERIVAFSGRFRWVATDGFSNIIPASASPLLEPLLAGLRRTSERDLDPHVSPRRPLRLAPGDNWGEVAPRLAEGCGSDSLTRAVNGRATIAMMLEAAGNANERVARFRQIYLLMSTMAVRASMEVIPMAAGAPGPALSAPASGGQRPSGGVDGGAHAGAAAASMSSGAAAPAPRPSPAPSSSSASSSPLPGMGGPGSAAPGPAPKTSPIGATKAAKVAVDENVDRGQLFSPEETEARSKIAAKFDELVDKDYFAILGIKRGADIQMVKKAYLLLARDFHTDAFAGLNLGSAQKKLDHVFSTIQTAYATLSDEKKRGEYEAKLSFDEQGASSDLELIFQAEADMNRAKQLVERNELKAALPFIEKALPVMPKNDEVLGYLKYCQWWQQGKSVTAGQQVIKDLELHFRAQPGSLALKEFQGWIAMEINDLRTAKIAFKKVLEMDPKHAGATRGSRALQRKMEDEEKKSSSGLGKFLKR